MSSTVHHVAGDKGLCRRDRLCGILYRRDKGTHQEIRGQERRHKGGQKTKDNFAKSGFDFDNTQKLKTTQTTTTKKEHQQQQQ